MPPWILDLAGTGMIPNMPGRLEEQAHRSALAGLADDARDAPRLARHSVDHRQAEAGSLADLLGGQEGLESSLAPALGHAHAGIADAELDIFAGLEIGIMGDRHLARVETQHAPVGHCVAS